MQYNLLASVVDKTRAVSIPEAALLALLGFAIVVLGIAFLILILSVSGKVMSKINAKSTAPKERKETKQAEIPQAVQAVSDELDDETVAVIMAAIMAYYQQTNAKCDFKVKRIKRI